MYKTSGQLKQEVRESLQGRWKEAILLNLAPVLLRIASIVLIWIAVGGIVLLFSLASSNSGMDFSSSVEGTSSAAAGNSGGGVSPIINFVMTLITVGISFTFLDVIRNGKEKEMKFKDAFSIFNGNDFVPVFLINLLTYLFTFFWSLLFFIPGVVKYYSYSQSNFIYKDLSTHKDVRSMGATSFISESRSLMKGHKGRLFLLDLSFIGWYLLGGLTFGIALLWVYPYVTATKAAFYNDLAKDRFLEPEPEANFDEEEWTNF